MGANRRSPAFDSGAGRMKNVAGNEVNILYAKGANISDDVALAEKVNVFGTRIDIDERSPEAMLREAVNTCPTRRCSGGSCWRSLRNERRIGQPDEPEYS